MPTLAENSMKSCISWDSYRLNIFLKLCYNVIANFKNDSSRPRSQANNTKGNVRNQKSTTINVTLVIVMNFNLYNCTISKVLNLWNYINIINQILSTTNIFSLMYLTQNHS